MKKILFLMLSAALVLAVLVAPVAAAPAPDLAALARYFPADTPLFFSVRTDPAFLDEIDGLIAHVYGNLPPGTKPPASLRQSLELVLSEQYGKGATLESALGWLGDSAAFGVISPEAMFSTNSSNDDEMVALLAMEIVDRDAAEAALTYIVTADGRRIESRRSGDWTLLGADASSDAVWALNDEVLVLAPSVDLLPLSDDRASLAGNADFIALIDALPAPDYNALLALNFSDVMRAAYSEVVADASSTAEADLMRSLQPLFEHYPRQVLGFTLLGDRTLTMDFVQSAFDYALLESGFSGISGLLDAEPVDLAFAERVPADAPFLMLGSDLGNYINYGIDTFTVLIELGIRADAARASRDEYVPAFVEGIEASDVRAFIDLAVAGMTGLNLESDILPYINGNAAFYARGLPLARGSIALDTAVVIEVTDQAAMRHIYDSLVDALTRYKADFTQPDGVIVLPNAMRGMYPRDTSREPVVAPEYDVLIGLNDDVLVAGTRAAVEHSLNPVGGGLTQNVAFQAARAQFLPDAQSVGYIGFAPTRDLFEIAARFSGMRDRETEEMLTALDLFESASYSARVDGDGSSVARFTLTLAE